MPPVAPPVPPAGAVREATQVFSDRSAAVERKIVALLVTYSWKPGGEVYFVREGRNFIGRQLDCEIAVPGDPRMSARHATILFRSDGSREFHLVDERSQNGTYVNGRVVETLERLENYCSIQAGDTHFRFVMIDP
jgi:pSer/pThr/pTyr-binding forkhead associated (FHA) protein